VTSSSAPPAARVSAANAILDRGWGKRKETVDITAKGPTLEELVLASFKFDHEIDKAEEKPDGSVH